MENGHAEGDRKDRGAVAPPRPQPGDPERHQGEAHEPTEPDSAGRLGRDRIRVAALWRFSYLALQGGLSLGLFIVLGQALSAGSFAATAVALGVLVIAQTLGDFGLSQALVTDLPARTARRPEQARELFAAAAYAVFIASGIALAVCAASAALVPSSAAVGVLVMAPAAAAGVLLAGTDGVLRAQGEFGRPVAYLAVSRVAPFVAVPVALATDSAGWTCAAVAGGTVLGSVPAGVALARECTAAARDRVSTVFRASLPLGSSQLFVLAGGRVDTLILGTLSTLAMAAVFEGVWRVHQLGQYLAGGLATALAPFMATSFGSQRIQELRGLLTKALLAVVVAGLAWGGLIFAGRDLVGDVLFESESAEVVRAIVPFAVLSPIAFAGYLSATALAASASDRRFIVLAHAVGALVNVGLVVAVAEGSGADGAALACAIGLGITNLALVVRCVFFLRRQDAG